MGITVEEIAVGADGAVWVGALGLTLPTDPTSTPAAGFVNLGLANDKGVTVTDTKTMTKIAAWQLFYSARQIVTDRDLTAAFDLMQWDRNTVSLAFGGGTWATVAGVSTYTPPSPSNADERTMIVDWADGTRHYRLIILRGLVTSPVATNLVRSAAAVLPITFSILGVDGSAPWLLITDDPAFAS